MIEWENHDIIIEMTPEGRDGASVTARGVWEADEHYYYLDIVTYGGGSYLAKTDVPAGTLPTNGTYWQTVASNAHWGEITGDLSDQEDLAEALDSKADADAVYTKTEADALLADKADKTSVYTKTEADSLLSAKADKATTYTKTQTDDLLDLKADKADTYTKTELDGIFDGIDNALDSKADKTSVYTKTETNNLLAQKANSADVYSKTAVDNALATKANTADLGTMAGVNDAPSDGKTYARKNGQWAEVEGGGGGGSAEWGAITGTLSDQTDLSNALLDKAPVILSNASGSIASFSDGSPAPVTALSVGIEPVQDLHGYSNPWPAGGGKNLIGLQDVASGTLYGITYSVVNGVITLSGTANDSFSLTIPLASTTDLNPTQNKMAMNNSAVINGASVYFKRNSTIVHAVNLNQVNRVVEWTAGADETVNSVEVVVSNGTTANVVVKPCLMLKTISDTTFAPYSNVCPISGHTSAVVTRTGKNLDSFAGIYPSLPLTKDGVTVTRTDYTFTFNGTVANGYKVMSNCNYKIKARKTGQMYVYFYIMDRAGTIGSGKLRFELLCYNSGYNNTTAFFPASATNGFLIYNNINYLAVTEGEEINVAYARVVNANSESLAVDFDLKVGIGYDNTLTEFPDYQGTSVTIDLDGTRYGGVLDVLTGELTVTHAIIKPKDVLSSFGSVTALRDGSGYYTYKPSTFPSSATGALAISDSYYKPASLLNNQWENLSFGQYWSTTYLILTVPLECNTIALARAYISELNPTFLYPLATPLTVQLTPSQMQTLLGQNAIWASTGDTSVEYRADTKLFIENLTKPSEDDMTANANIASGKYFMVGNNLFLSTASIATGDAIKPGTNCTALSLAEALNAINA